MAKLISFISITYETCYEVRVKTFSHLVRICPYTKKPHRKCSRHFLWDLIVFRSSYYFVTARILRNRAPAEPSRPVPRSSRVLGSGVTPMLLALFEIDPAKSRPEGSPVPPALPEPAWRTMNVSSFVAPSSTEVAGKVNTVPAVHPGG